VWLEQNVVLKGRYEIKEQISIGEFSIVYSGYDKKEKQKCIIKEFYPSGKVLRDMDAKTVVYKKPTFKDKFYKQMEYFLNEGYILKKYKHKNIVEYIDHFKENDTGYIVLKHYKGETLDKYLKENGVNYIDILKNIFIPIIDAINFIHKKGIIHRDIKPSNILIDESNQPIIIDFGSAVNYKKDKIKRIFYTPAYSPIEFYSEKSKQGRYSDLYSIAATLYYCLSGKPPENVPRRIIEDEIDDIRLFNKDISELFSKAIMKNLSLNYKDRFSSVNMFKMFIYIECMIKIREKNNKIKRFGDDYGQKRNNCKSN
jgi:serine/threonine protein kinase